MATFKEVMKRNWGKTKLLANKVGNSDAFKIAAPIGSIVSSALLTKKRLSQERRLHKEQIENLTNLSEDIKDLEGKVSSLEEGFSKDQKEDENKEKKKKKVFVKFKKKEFSLESGGFNKGSSRQVVSEGMRKIAEESKLRSTEESSENLLNTVKEELGEEDYCKNGDPMLVACDNSRFISICQKGDVLVFFLKYVSSSDLTRLNKILDSYCETFSNTDYSSDYFGIGDYCIVEVWVAEGSLKYLIRKLAEHYKINVIE